MYERKSEISEEGYCKQREKDKEVRRIAYLPGRTRIEAILGRRIRKESS
jgi:hypothetical protein